MSIVQYIIEILNENQKVEIPGLGIFTLENKAAAIHPIEHSFTPPSKNIQFKNVFTNDELLARKISENEHISFQDAIISIQSFIDNLLSDIQKGKLAGIEGIGVFSLTDDKLIAFVPESNGFSDESYGLSGFTSPAIVRTEFKDKAALNVQKAKDEKINKSKKRRRYLLVSVFVVVVTALIFLVFFTDIFRNYLYNNDLDSKTEQTVILNEKPAPVQETITDTASLNIDSASSTNNNISSIETNKVDGNINTSENSQAIRFYLVAGSFKSEENANKSVAAIKAKGYTNAGIIRQGQDKGMFVVYYESHSNQEEASNALKQIIKNENRDAWLLKK
jgi:nucleoid DNA-binding protein